MKKLIWLASLMLLTGCAATSQPRPQPPAKAPAGLVKILADDQLTSYIDYPARRKAPSFRAGI